MYYKNNFKRNRFSIRNSGSNDRFSRPSNEGRFRNPRFYSNNRSGGQRKSQLEGANINIFIKKANQAIPEENITNTRFEDFNISEILKQNILKHGYVLPPREWNGLAPREK